MNTHTHAFGDDEAQMPDHGARRAKIATAIGGAMLALSLVASPASAARPDVPVKATPNPLPQVDTEPPDLPGCFGNLNATFNHDSGIQDHGRDSKGPGFYFRNGQDFKEAREFTRGLFCS